MKPKEIKLKFDVGEEIWWIRNNKPEKASIVEIKVTRRAHMKTDSIQYGIGIPHSGVHMIINPASLHRTKQSLQDSLFG